MIFNILDNTTELWMTKNIIDEIFSSSGATLYKNPPDQTVNLQCKHARLADHVISNRFLGYGKQGCTW